MNLNNELKELPYPWELKEYKLKDQNKKPLTILVIDTETTGFTPAEAEVIEIAGAEMKVDRVTGETFSITPLFDFLREPVRSNITEEITRVTSLTFQDVVNQSVDYDVLYDALHRCDILAAHHMGFDLPFMEDLAEELVHKPKRCACTCYDPLWNKLISPVTGKRFSAKKLTTILGECGYKFPAHRAHNDVNATVTALSLFPEAVKRLIAKASSDVIYQLDVKSVPWGYNEKLTEETDLNWNRPTKSFRADFADMDDVLYARAQLQTIFGRSFSNLELSLTSTTPYARFSK